MRRSLLSPGPVLVLVVAAAVAAAVRADFTDLFVYQYGGRALLDGLPLYGSRDPVKGLAFTYPPFAAVLLVPLALVPYWLAAALWTGASVGALAAVVTVVRREFGRPTPGWLVALLAAGAIALEPVWQTLTFGQVNVLLMLAVLVDLVRPDRRWSGVLVGVAAGVKLTPLLFVVLLVLVGRRTAAGRAVLAFAGTVAVGFVAMPGAAATYWTHGLLAPGRVGPPSLAHNQSVYGALTRLLDGTPPDLLWLVLAGPLALAVLLAGAGWWRHGDRVLGTGLAALAMLLLSPVAWSHHWVWAVPLALALWERSRSAAVGWTAVFVARPIVWPPYGRQREYGWGVGDHLAGHAYLLAALAVAGWAAVTLIRRVGLPGRRYRAAVIEFPRTRAVPVLRTCFADDDLWERLKEEIASPTEEGFTADVDFVDDRAFADLDEDAIRRSLPGRYPETFPHPVLFVVDAGTAGAADHPVLVVDLHDEPEPSFRTTPRGIQAIENNLSIANMDFEEFAAAAGGDGVYRGF